MATSDWGSSFSDDRASPVRGTATPTYVSRNVGNISPIHNSGNNSQIDSGQTSPGLGDTPHNVSIWSLVLKGKISNINLFASIKSLFIVRYPKNTQTCYNKRKKHAS